MFKDVFIVHEKEKQRNVLRLEGRRNRSGSIKVFHLQITLVKQFSYFPIARNFGQMKDVDGRLVNIFNNQVAIFWIKTEFPAQ